jgi:hypothetical protein
MLLVNNVNIGGGFSENLVFWEYAEALGVGI